MEKTEYDGMFQKNCVTAVVVSGSVGLLSFACTIPLAFLSPPAALGAFVVGIVSSGIDIGSGIACGIKCGIEYLSNKEFNEQTVSDELLIEDENNF